MILGKKIKTSRHGLFQFSKKIDDGLFLLTHLAQIKKKEPLSLKKIAEENKRSFFFLQKIANDLRQASLLKSTRGKNGGYLLAKSPQKITLKNICEALEGRMAIMSCLEKGNSKKICRHECHCHMKKGMNVLNMIMIKTLSSTTLDQITVPSKIKNVPLSKPTLTAHKNGRIEISNF